MSSGWVIHCPLQLLMAMAFTSWSISSSHRSLQSLNEVLNRTKLDHASPWSGGPMSASPRWSMQ